MTLINFVAANQKNYAFNLLSVFIMVFWSVQYLLQYLLVQTQLSDQLLQPLILILQLPQTPQFRHARPGKFFLPVNGMDYLLPLRLTVRNVLTRRITMNIVFLGIDLAKNVFQLCGLNQAGKLTISGVGSIFLIRKLKQYSDNQKPVSVSPKLKALVLKRPRPLLLLLAKELNLRMVATLLHGWVWFHASIRVATGRC